MTCPWWNDRLGKKRFSEIRNCIPPLFSSFLNHQEYQERLHHFFVQTDDDLINKSKEAKSTIQFKQTHVHRKKDAINITYYSRLGLFSSLFSFFFFLFAAKRMKKMIVWTWLYDMVTGPSRNQMNEDSLLRCILSSLWVCVYKLYSFL